MGVLIGLSVAAGSEAAVILTFTKVADTSTPIPGGTGVFDHFGQPSSELIAPAISGSNVVFVGSRGSEQHGMYLYSNGVLSRLADRTTPVPSGTGNMSHFGALSIDGRNVTVRGHATDQTGVYKYVNGAFTRVADDRMLLPGGSTRFNGFSSPSIDGSSVYVYGTGFPNEGVYTDAGGTLKRIADTSTRVPGSTNTFSDFNSNVAAANGQVIFHANSPGTRGIYRADGTTISRIAESGTAAPGGGNFAALGYIYLGFDGEDALFVGSTSSTGGNYGLYRTRGSDLERVLPPNATIAGYGQVSFDELTPVALDGENMAFQSGSALFADFGEGFQKVIGRGDTLLGRTVNGVLFEPDGLDDNRLTFVAVFQGGGEGIFMAEAPLPDPPPAVPLPAALVCGLVSVAIWTASSGRRQATAGRARG